MTKSLDVFNKDAKQELIENHQITPLAKMDFDLKKVIRKYGYSNKDKLAMNSKLVSLEEGLDEVNLKQNAAVETFIQ